MDLHDIVSSIKLLASDLGKTPTLVEFIADSGVSKRQISKHGWNNLVKMAGLEPNLNSQQRKPVSIEIREPKILILDIEVAPIKAFVYGLWQQNIAIDYILEDWFVFSWAAKWAGKKEIMYADVSSRKLVQNDEYVCKKIHKLISEADILVGHNSDRFDIKKLNTRFIKHGLDPIPKLQSIDTLKVARRYFKFTSNKLDYIAKFLGIEGKYKSKKFTQREMWKACYNKDKEAWKENKIYNKQDVEITEKVFDKLKTWDASLNFQAYLQKAVCICGSEEFKKDGVRYTKQSAFQRYKCAECGKHYTDKTNLLNKELRQGFFK